MTKQNKILLLGAIFLFAVMFLQLYGNYKNLESSHERQEKRYETVVNDLVESGLSKTQSQMIANAIRMDVSTINYNSSTDFLMQTFMTTICCLMVLSLAIKSNKKEHRLNE